MKDGLIATTKGNLGAMNKTEALLADLAMQASRSRKRRSRLRVAITDLAEHGDWRAVPALFGYLDESGIGPVAAKAIERCLKSLAPTDLPEFDGALRGALSAWDEERLNRWPVRALDVGATEQESEDDESTTSALLCATACHPNDMHRERALEALASRPITATSIGLLLLRITDPIEETRELARRILLGRLDEDKDQDHRRSLADNLAFVRVLHAEAPESYDDLLSRFEDGQPS